MVRTRSSGSLTNERSETRVRPLPTTSRPPAAKPSSAPRSTVPAPVVTCWGLERIVSAAASCSEVAESGLFVVDGRTSVVPSTDAVPTTLSTATFSFARPSSSTAYAVYSTLSGRLM